MLFGEFALPFGLFMLFGALYPLAICGCVTPRYDKLFFERD